MTLFSNRFNLVALALIGLCDGPSAFAQSTPYYIADGDGALMSVVQGGSIVDTFAIPTLGYPIAVDSTIWLGNRDDAGANEFTLAGIPTGNSSAGGNNFHQLLDGTTNGINNFGVECCGSPNSVTIANLDWSNQTVLFNLPTDGLGITFDPTTNHLFVGTYTQLLLEYDLNGNLINSFNVNPLVTLSSLAYESATDTLWSSRNHTVWQLDKTGIVLQSFGVADLGNNWGGEMPYGFVPEPTSLVLLVLSAGGLLAGRRRGC
jgi:hypothetical protein